MKSWETETISRGLQSGGNRSHSCETKGIAMEQRGISAKSSGMAAE